MDLQVAQLLAAAVAFKDCKPVQTPFVHLASHKPQLHVIHAHAGQTTCHWVGSLQGALLMDFLAQPLYISSASILQPTNTSAAAAATQGMRSVPEETSAACQADGSAQLQALHRAIAGAQSCIASKQYLRPVRMWNCSYKLCTELSQVGSIAWPANNPYGPVVCGTVAIAGRLTKHEQCACTDS